MSTHTVKNRYGMEHTFTLLENNNILWKGDFKMSRTGASNDYTDAYSRYQEDGGDLPKESFIEKVTEFDSKSMKYSDLGRKYMPFVKPDFSKISMVDPSGGPYLEKGMPSEEIHPEVKGKKISEFVRLEDGILIIFS